MKLLTLSKDELKRKLADQGLSWRVGAFNVCLTSSIPEISDHIHTHYGDFKLLVEKDFIDFYVDLAPPNLLRRFIRPQVNFSFDGLIPFKPLPYAQASAMFEWCLNWCIANHSHQYLIIHAAVVERNGQTFVFPGLPGSGKSTLCAALVCSGWRLLSDEMALLAKADGLLYPVPRPISLKNHSIEIIQGLADNVIFGQVVNDTAKGTVGHMRPPNESVELSTTPGKPAKLVFPKFEQGAITVLKPLSKCRSLLKVADNSFNFSIMGGSGFQLLSNMIDNCDCYEFKYHRISEAIELFESLAAG